ncbi:solute carrier family 22 member 3 isoform X2 [Drosophila biarmipes]|uniref:solute carrier family 22 member 3 isoform X2 n=1 Tax=Drosophila biarmipes TaxID=125945 RepID=UPI0007E6E899|nr:solute carrier family 22 member 3 isoform X2 [Drosophila biarmipes]
MPPKNCENYEDFLPIIGDFGAFQKILLLWMMPTTFIFSFTYFGQIFMILVPKNHWCRIRELEDLPMKEQINRGIPKNEDDDFKRCLRFDIPFDSDRTNTTNRTRTQIPCNDGWIYDRDEIPYESIATEYNWVCDKKELGTYSVIAFFMGSIVGCLCLGYIADHQGRLVALFLANFCALIGGLVSVFCKDFYCFAASRFVAGLALNNSFVCYFILVIENVGIKYRTLVGNLALAVFFTLGACTLPWLAYAFDSWRHYALSVSLPVAFVMLMCFLIPESPSWLISVGKVERGMKVLRKAARINKKNISEEEWLKMKQCFELKFADEQSGKKYSFLDLFKSCRRLVVIAILIISWMIVALAYDAHVRVVELFDTNVFITFSLASLVELPAGILPILLLDRIGRKPIMTAALLFCAASSLSTGLLKSQWDVTTSAIVARFFVGIAYNVEQQWASEVLPTVLRGQGLAVINVLGQVGALLSPVVIYTHHYYRSLPMFIITLLLVIGASVILLLPETKNTTLPQTLEEADKRWVINCRCRKVKDDQ